MQELEVFLKTAADGLKSLGKVLETLGEKLDELARAEREEKAEPVEKKIAIKAEEKEAPPEEKGVTAAQAVFDVIKRSRKGVDTATLKEKTGFNSRKIQNVIYKLKKQGKIKSERKGIYVKA